MKLALLILAIVVFLVLAILALAGGGWSTAAHLEALLGLGLALFAAAFLPFTGPTITAP